MKKRSKIIITVVIFLISVTILVASGFYLVKVDESVAEEEKLLQRNTAAILQKTEGNKKLESLIPLAYNIKKLYPKESIEMQINNFHCFLKDRSSNIQLISILPSTQNIKDNEEIAKINISCTVVGEYSELVQLLEDIEGIESYKTISNISLKYHSETDKVLMSFMINTYALTKVPKSQETGIIEGESQVLGIETKLEKMFGTLLPKNNILVDMRQTQKEVETGIKIENSEVVLEGLGAKTTTDVSINKRPFPMSQNAKILSEYNSIIYSSNGSLITNRCVDLQVFEEAEIINMEDGIVVYVGSLDEFKDTIIVKGNDKTTTLYANLSSAYVKYGQNVKKGQVIGMIGENKNYVKYLELGIIENNIFVDPKSYIDTGKIY
ncbi:MAG TPA: hypothetical protein DEP72_02100 [Clostridiales bacterium]|nr:MAG: hypothetical protein A2Y18_00290 [Clostridiales bacterium GWD2_32_19]HCC06948.1 hypothetical protein [Clostridiales bacterium]